MQYANTYNRLLLINTRLKVGGNSLIQADEVNGGKWLNSQSIRQCLKISGCELMHSREKGDIEFKKVVNAYWYKLPKTTSE